MTSTETKKRIIELDVLKAFAIIGVILIHVVSGSLFSFAKTTIEFKAAIFVDQFFRFSVPLFVALSGYTLALKYKDQKLNLIDFFKRRVLRILPWYFFWTGIIYLYIKTTHWGINSQHFPWWKILFLGKADYHLYFVPMIFQLYLLFPLLLFLFKKFRLKFLILLLIAEIIFYEILSYFALGKIKLPIFLNDQQQYLFAGTWIFYFVFGIFLSFSAFTKNNLKILKALSLPLLIGAFIALLINTFSIINQNFDVIIATRSTRVSTLYFASVFILVSILFGDKLLQLPKKLVAYFDNFGKRSYVTYLCHTIILRIFSDIISPSSIPKIMLLAILTIIASDTLAYLSINVFGKLFPKDRKFINFQFGSGREG